MHKLIAFIRNIYVVVLFLLIEIFAISYYARSTHYTRARLLAQATQVVGGGEDFFAWLGRYFGLERENRELLEYAASLQRQLSDLRGDALRLEAIPAGADTLDTHLPPRYDEARRSGAAAEADSLLDAERSRLDLLMNDRHYRTMTAAVIANTVNRTENFLVINRGFDDGVTREMAVLSAGGAIVGHVVECTDHYAIVLSVLSSSFRTSGKLSGSNYFGQIYWDGSDTRTVLLSELPKYAEPLPGTEVETTGSLFFPDGLRIGTVVDAELDEGGITYTARVELAARMTGLSHVILVQNLDLDEINRLLGSDNVKP